MRPTSTRAADRGDTEQVVGRRTRIHGVDLIRVSLFTLVLMVHATGSINWDPDHVRGMQFFTMMVHIARYGFVFVTGFVLFLAYYRSPITASTFWRRRYGFVAAPYLAWSVIYVITGYAFVREPWPDAAGVTGDIGTALLQGNAQYQMYFLLISMQIYLLFPLVRMLLRRTEGHHGKVMAGAVAIQAGMFTLFSFYHPDLDWYGHMWKTLPTYALFLVGGALAAVHYERFAPWVRRNRHWLMPLSLAGAAFTVVMFFVTTGDGHIPGLAYAAWSVQNLPWYLGAVALFFIVGQAWDDRRGDGTGWGARLVDYGAVRAFGIFAVHPLVIDLIHQSGFVDWLYATYPDTTLQRSILLVLVTLVASLCLVELILYTPLARVLVAHDRIRPRRKPRAGGESTIPPASKADACAEPAPAVPAEPAPSATAPEAGAPAHGSPEHAGAAAR
ncbi:acyltransferase [Tomitella fengzijianii]|uniref:acyltransferase n=1 Tax=Tomitella fengzijianii TaxID=2597660 RepID=UPI00131D7401|nr:acyltransferase [Tomitella fengzijianii]